MVFKLFGGVFVDVFGMFFCDFGGVFFDDFGICVWRFWGVFLMLLGWFFEDFGVFFLWFGGDFGKICWCFFDILDQQAHAPGQDRNRAGTNRNHAGTNRVYYHRQVRAPYSYLMLGGKRVFEEILYFFVHKNDVVTQLFPNDKCSPHFLFFKILYNMKSTNLLK